MNQSFSKLYNEFTTIKERNWVKSLRQGQTGIGYTFETLLNKQEDNLQIPDYLDIEIKTMRYYTKQNIQLFNASPDGDLYFPIKRILSTLGYPDKDFPEYNVFYSNLKANEYKFLKAKKIKLFVNWEKQKIEILAYNTTNNEVIKTNASWSFKLIEKAINSKLKKLAIVKAKTKMIKNIEYFNYDQISFYELKSLNTFLKLIEQGIINVSFNISIYKDKANLGRIRNRGTGFIISEKDIPLLFNKVEINQNKKSLTY